MPAIKMRGFSGDTVPAIAPSGGPGASASAPAWPDAVAQVIYVSFGGERLLGSSSDDATTNHSQICDTQIPPYNGAVPAPKVTQQQAVDAVADRLRTFYAPYNVSVVTSRPASGSYTMVVVGGSHAMGCEPAGVAGVSPLDCNNFNKSNVVYDFSDDQSPDYGGVVAIAVTAGHETGHSFGLEHTDNANDIMYSVSNPNQTIQQLFGLRFTTTGHFSSFNAGGGMTTQTCSSATNIDNDAILLGTLGASTRIDINAPALTWKYPLATPVQPMFPVTVDASDNVGVKRVEIYKNLELIAMLGSAPYTTNVTVANGEAFYLTAEAIDDSGNRTTATRTFLADVNNPPMCPTGSCPAGRLCKNGLCLLTLGAPCAKSGECASAYCKTVDMQMQCTAICDAVTPCPESGECVNGLCVPSGSTPMPKNIGEACAAATECASGRCQTVCVDPCDDTSACADATLMCAAVDGGMGCIPMDPNMMMPPPEQPSGCAMSPAARAPRRDAAGALLLLLLLFTVVVGRSYRARRATTRR
jgi:Bacterial Ig domain